ncbi:hypothetical protein [Alkalicoccus halolimnae]|uniref:Uncharacterized protein n=1 Tax=Alkalicoccus halolimnae TaxID=1667239 RepID=A0A5C7FJA5_9BACI|nr:hypothetical protein [Alkalicoccus halolimnae]TXF86209.1 hypothetical protein FTX54_06270 [Alkalicoccus halolimnae]
MEIDLRSDYLKSWLSPARKENKDLKYRHLKLSEMKSSREDIIPYLQQVINEAHEDYKRCKRAVLSDSLDPGVNIDFDELGDLDPAYGYPNFLDMNTLKGYFGEIFSGIIAENFSPFNINNWKVPVFSFRHHETAFDQLETYKRTGNKKKATIGRPGDDCLAFVLNEESNKIEKMLFIEAKCTDDHKSDLINKAHSQISDKNPVPVELIRLLEILRDYDSDYAKKWSIALSNLYLKKNEEGQVRFDLVSYVCGRSPIRKQSWMDSHKPHELYKGKRDLESVEIHVSNVDQLVKKVYQKEED